MDPMLSRSWSISKHSRFLLSFFSLCEPFIITFRYFFLKWLQWSGQGGPHLSRNNHEMVEPTISFFYRHFLHPMALVFFFFNCKIIQGHRVTSNLTLKILFNQLGLDNLPLSLNQGNSIRCFSESQDPHSSATAYQHLQESPMHSALSL